VKYTRNGTGVISDDESKLAIRRDIKDRKRSAGARVDVQKKQITELRREVATLKRVLFELQATVEEMRHG
jgi:hypothetical protein